MKVLITGLGVMSSLGNSVEELFDGLKNNRCNIKIFADWEKLNGLSSFLGAPVPEYDVKKIPRVIRRSMSRMSEMALLATMQALEQADISLDGSDVNNSLDLGRTSLIVGSTSGSPIAFEAYYRKLFDEGGPRGQLSTSFLKTMNHSVAANIAAGLGYVGAMLPVSSACSTSAHSIILGMELIKSGLYDVVIAGGADELHYTSACVFDVVHAASTGYNNNPNEASRPFDIHRDGLVVSEGASIVILESEEHAKKRGAKGLAEVVGGAYLCDGTHMTQPQIPAMAKTMTLALKRSNMSASQIDYVNAHATSTVIGDIDESRAIEECLGKDVPVSSIKGHLGHSLAACGGIEVAACVMMIQNDVIIPTRNLIEVDPNCAGINLIQKKIHGPVHTVLSNNFAFGGMNTSLILSKIIED